MCTRKVAGTKGENALLRDRLSRVNRTPWNLTHKLVLSVSQWSYTIAWGRCVLVSGEMHFSWFRMVPFSVFIDTF